MKDRRAAAFGAAALLLTVACGGAPAPDDPRAGSRRPAGAAPSLPTDIDQLDAPIQRQLRERHAALGALLEQPAADERLAAAWGAWGKALHAHDFTAAAADAYRRASELAAEPFGWLYYLGRVEQKRGDWPAADDALTRALELRPRDVPALVATAQGRLDRGRLDRARTLFEGALAVDPTCAVALAGLGQIALELGDSTAAAAFFERALALQPAAAQLHYQLGRAHQLAGDAARAASHFALVPANNLVQTPIHLDDPLMAELETLRVGARSHDLRGIKALAEGRYALAAIELRQALAADPDRIYAHYGLALALHHLERHDEAAEALGNLLRVAPNDAPSLLLMGRIELARGRRDDAVRRLEDAVHAGEPTGEAGRLLATLDDPSGSDPLRD